MRLHEPCERAVEDRLGQGLKGSTLRSSRRGERIYAVDERVEALFDVDVVARLDQRHFEPEQ